MKLTWRSIGKSMDTQIDHAHMGIKTRIENDQKESGCVPGSRTSNAQTQGSFLSLVSSSSCLPQKNLPSSPLFPCSSTWKPSCLSYHPPSCFSINKHGLATTLMGSHALGQLSMRLVSCIRRSPPSTNVMKRRKWLLSRAPSLQKGSTHVI